LQRINPQPHEARLQREQSPQTESNPETTSIGFPNNVTFEPTIIQGHQDNITPSTTIQGHKEDKTPRMSNLNPLQPKVEPSSTEGTTGLRRSTRIKKKPEQYMNGYLATVIDNFQND
jgi:phage FluMu protein Com